MSLLLRLWYYESFTHLLTTPGEGREKEKRESLKMMVKFLYSLDKCSLDIQTEFEKIKNLLNKTEFVD
jgi:hypothetical protein